MGKESHKSALPTLFHFVRVRAAFQPHVIGIKVQIYPPKKQWGQLRSDKLELCINKEFKERIKQSM